MPPTAAAAQPCESLTSLKLPDTTIAAATLVQEGPFAPPAPPVPGARAGAPLPVPSFCRVQLTIAPQIRVEVWMPATGWNGKFEGVGGGGYAGIISYPAMANAVRAGYATASTDTGHTGGTADFALNHPEKLIDFGYPAIQATRKVERLRRRRDSRTDGFCQAGHRRVLWRCAEDRLLQRLLDRRTPGDH